MRWTVWARSDMGLHVVGHFVANPGCAAHGQKDIAETLVQPDTAFSTLHTAFHPSETRPVGSKTGTVSHNYRRA